VSGDVGGTIDRDDVIGTNAAPICRPVGPAGVGTSTNFDKRFSYAVTVSRQNEIRVETGLVHGFRQIWVKGVHLSSAVWAIIACFGVSFK